MIFSKLDTDFRQMNDSLKKNQTLNGKKIIVKKLKWIYLKTKDKIAKKLDS